MIPLRNMKRFFYKAAKQPIYACKVFIKRIRAYLYYWLGRGRSSLPEAVTLFLTHRCNLHCKMCGQWGESGVTKKMSTDLIREELTFDKLKSVIDNISSFRPNITLFGGEPLLYSHCLELVRYIKIMKLHCLMITNGSLLNKFAGEMVDAGLDELNVSLDGGKKLHDEIRGMPGLFDRITEGLKELSNIKKERDLKRPFVNLQCTITKYNYRHLEQLLKVAEEVGADSLTYHNLIFLGRELIEKQREYDRLLGCSSKDWEGFVFEPEIEPEILYSKIREIRTASARYRFNIDFYPNFSSEELEEYYKNSSYRPSGYSAKCLSPWMTAYIFPDGELRPCLNFDYSYGNIKEDDFIEIWNGDPAIKYRRILKEKNIFPVCVRCTEFFRY